MIEDENESTLSPGELAHAGLRGVIAAMAMSGMRAATKSLGLMEQAPPQAIFRRRAKLLVLWLGFEMGVAPALGLKQSRQLRPVERAALATDHLLYGLVLSETRSRPRE